MKYVFTADWHIRGDKPSCRKSNFLDIQKKTIEQIFAISNDNNAVLVHAGDIFHSSKIKDSEYWLSFLFDRISYYNISFAFIAGNHDLPEHSVKAVDNSSFGAFKNALHLHYGYSMIEALNNFASLDYPCNFNTLSNNAMLNSFLVLHCYCAEKAPGFIKDGISASGLLDELSFKVFVTGDNHHGFVFEKDGRFVINPGCITRQAVDMKDYKPFVVLFDDLTFSYEKIYLCDNDVDDFDLFEYNQTQERKDRLDSSFVTKLKSTINIDYSFEDNLKKECVLSKASDSVENIIKLALKGGIEE